MELYDVVKEKRMGWVGTIVEILPDDCYTVEWEDDWLFAYGENLEPWDGLPSLDEQNEGILEDHYRSLNMGGWGVQ